MPTYDYRCKRCSHTFEAFQRITADALTKCPGCGRKALERLIGSGAGIIFKGSGFYATDYGRSSSSPAASGGSDSESSGSAGESASD